jgi:hypothetical protein
MKETKGICLYNFLHSALNGCSSIEQISKCINERIDNHNYYFPLNPVVSWKLTWDPGYGQEAGLSLDATVKLSPAELESAKKAQEAAAERQKQQEVLLKEKEYEDFLKLKAKYEGGI